MTTLHLVYENGQFHICSETSGNARSAFKPSGGSFLELLSRCGERRVENGVFADDSMLQANLVLRRVGELVAQGRFLPGIEEQDDGIWTARWRPLDRSQVSALAPKIEARLLECVTDALVRASVVTTLSDAQARNGHFYSAHDAWFAALRGESPVIRWKETADLRKLRDEIEVWNYPVTWQQQTSNTLRFELSPPDCGEESWPLKIQISGSNGLTPFPADLSNSPLPRELLLALGQAVTFFPPLATAAGYDGRLECRLSRDEAYVFLVSAAQTLNYAGYEAAAADTIDLTNHSVEWVLEGGDTADNTPDLDAALPVRWSLTIDGQPLSRDELSMLMNSNSPVISLRGRWIMADLKKLRDALRSAVRRTDDKLTAREIIRYAFGISDRNGLAVSTVRCGGWLQPLIRQLEGREDFSELEPPAGFTGTLRPYQLRGYSWLAFLRAWGFGACLADDMGLGKTIQALAFLLHEKAKGETRPVLLVAPMSVLGNWEREAARFAPGLRCRLHHGANRQRGDELLAAAGKTDVVLTSYALLHRDYTELRRIKWAGILLDEAQNIKNPDTRQSRAARALDADYRIALTGTPMENNVGDIWSILDFLNPGILGPRNQFRQNFFIPIQTGTDPDARLRLRRISSPFILRRLKTDRRIVADLPEKLESKVYCTLTPEQSRMYREVLESFDRDLDAAEGNSRRGLIFGVLTRLKQICNHPENYLGGNFAEAERSGKLTRLEEMLEEVFSEGESALVFTQYAEMGSLLQGYLSRAFAVEMPFLYGAVSRPARDKMVADFQKGGKPRAFILSLKAGGIGLNLTRATHVFHFDRWWNPAVEEQATDRAFRIGQTRRVMVHKFICGGTLEEKIDRMISDKTALSTEIVGSGEQFLTELSNERLREILQLD